MELLNLFYKKIKRNRVYLFNNRIPKTIDLLAMLRVRNEELIINDTLNHLSEFSDAIICFDDSSTDHTFMMLQQHPKVVGIIRNFNWARLPEERILLETLHRKSLLELAQKFNPDWVFCADADERYIGNIKQFIHSDESKDVDLVRIRLFDAYITQNDQQAFTKDSKLENFRVFFGPERRDIIMMWRPNPKSIKFEGKDSREPTCLESVKEITKFYCQHYGKALSINHWEETCDYYINHFPYEPYGKKWSQRKGKAIHSESDFGTPLYRWGQDLFDNAVVIHPVK